MTKELLEHYEQMLLIRRFEERAAELYAAGQIPGFVHLSTGQEAGPVGVCAALQPDDVITSTHRGHGHVLAKGADITGMFAELFGRATGTCGGYGGSMHIAAPELGIYGANGIVGAGVPIATGASFAMRVRGQGRVAVSFFGDGAVATGAFHEAVNLASLWCLPILFVCEVNGFSEFSRTEDQHKVPLATRMAGYGIKHVAVDGTDVEAVYAAAQDLVPGIRAGGGPAFLEVRTQRWRGHYEGDTQKYRDPAEERLDGVVAARKRLIAAGAEADVLAIEASVTERIATAVSTALAAPMPDPSGLEALALRGVYPQPDPPVQTFALEGQKPTRVSQSIRKALDDALAADERVVLAGIDVGAGGNVFGLTRGLYDKYPGRVWDTPISETAICGLAVGAAMDGLAPVVEIMYLDFIGVCLDQILNQAAKLRFMTGGSASMGLTVRTQFGVGRSSGSQHSQSLEALFAHIPGLVVVMPSSVEDHYGLLRSAIESPDPVIFIENRMLYEASGPPVDPSFRTPLGRARIAREGSDITIVASSRAVWTALEAAETLAAEGIAAEVVDLRTISPWDKQTVLTSLAKTNRLMVHLESVRDFGVSAEIVATAADEGFWSLDAPLRRLAGRRSPVPYSPSLEAAWLPTAADLVVQARELCYDR
jgi:2-oxoisovalerate dehydrogenase E1 component